MRSAALLDVRGHWTESTFSSERRFDVTGNHGNQGVAYSITQSVSHSFTPRARSIGIEYKLGSFSFNFLHRAAVR